MRYLLAAAAVVAAAPALADEAMIEEGFNLFQQSCRTCHVMTEGQHRLGPSLYGVIGRQVGSAEGFSYSRSLASATEEWDEAMLDAFIRDPDAVFPGNQMMFAGIPDAERRQAIIAYIDSVDNE